jgi:hypothetical protein
MIALLSPLAKIVECRAFAYTDNGVAFVAYGNRTTHHIACANALYRDGQPSASLEVTGQPCIFWLLTHKTEIGEERYEAVLPPAGQDRPGVPSRSNIRVHTAC